MDSLIAGGNARPRRSYRVVNNGYLWKADEHLNHVAKVRYAHGDELTDLPGVTGVGIGKDHIIVYVATEDVEVPTMLEDVLVVKVRRR
jgi:hypothetical protein